MVLYKVTTPRHTVTSRMVNGMLRAKDIWFVRVILASGLHSCMVNEC